MRRFRDKRSLGVANRRGYTILELTVVLIMVSIIAGMAVPRLNYERYRADAHTTRGSGVTVAPRTAAAAADEFIALRHCAALMRLSPSARAA